MSNKFTLREWDRIASSLEASALAAERADILDDPAAADRITQMRQLVSQALATGQNPAPRRLPISRNARRQLLRRMMSRRPSLSPLPLVASFSAPEKMSDDEIDAALRTFLRSSPEEFE